jgi:predicted transcriptional regulator
LLAPILGCILPNIGRYKTIMSLKKTEIGEDNKVISLTEAARKLEDKTGPTFSKGLYEWIMFIVSFYSRVRETLKIDFETFIILQVVVSHSLYQVNKTGSKTYSEIKEHVEKLSMVKLKKNLKLTFASISEVIQLPRETVRRKVLELCKKNILTFNNENGIKLGHGYKTIYKEFVSQTTKDIGTLVKKWKHSGALDKLLELDKK